MTRRCSTEILKKFRDVMKQSKYVNESLQAYIIPSVDAHQSEYIAPCDKRIEFISGFSGSRGTAVVTEKQAALWTDGRYFLQADQQLDENWTLMKERIEGTPSVGEWLNDVLPNHSRVGFDPFLLDNDTWKTLKKAFECNNNCLVPTDVNLVDAVWDNKPAIPSNSVDFLPIKYSGKSVEEKISEVRKEMSKQKSSILIITALDEIAWLFNLRGSDIDFNPVFFSYAVVTANSAYLFIDSKKLTEAAKNSLLSDKNLNLQILPYENIIQTLKELLKEKQSRVWVNKRSSYGIVSLIPKKNRYTAITPVESLKSVKNEVEISGSRMAHIKDGAALSEYFYWLSREISTGKLTEISAADKLEAIKKDLTDYVGLSFDTISASGSHAAIIHYKPSKETDRKLDPSEIYLCDCGTQYRDGTTDMTRTWHFGEPTPFERRCYTLVLKGHISLSRAIFPSKCTGHRIDGIARKFLWDAGLDYLHGTGHGVGSFLNVHEGPSGISSAYNSIDPGLQPGMILSIEPGYYEDNLFGIRLENLVLVKKAETENNFGDKGYLTFEPLTVFPFQTKLIDTSLLTSDEISWLNNYHSMCLEKVGGYLKELGKHDALQWLKEATIPLKDV